MPSTMSIQEARRVRIQFAIISAIAATAVLVGTIFMMLVERLSWVNALYFSVVSLTTVGYGDITPTTDFGKLFVSVYLLIGIGILGAFAQNLLRGATARRVIRKSGHVDTDQPES